LAAIASRIAANAPPAPQPGPPAAREQIVRIESLTSREREVMTLVTIGKMNKQIAAEIGLSEITVKVYRHNVIKKGLQGIEWVILRDHSGGNACG
jgi:DNA-binding NarL/FixJ family response regulator